MTSQLVNVYDNYDLFKGGTVYIYTRLTTAADDVACNVMKVTVDPRQD